jgi:FSR family fosmidomycin resistance protein-like MFS transporter
LKSPLSIVPVVPSRADTTPARAALALLCLGHFFIDLYSSALGALQPFLVSRLSLTLTQAGLLGGLLIFFSSVTQPFYGYLSDRFHTRWFTVISPALAAIFICSLSIVPSFGALIAAVALGGAGVAAFHPQASTWAANLSSEARGSGMAMFISAGTLGMALGPTVFSSFALAAGLRNVMWLAIPGVLVALFLASTLRGAPARPRHAGSEGWGVALLPHLEPLAVHYFLVFIRSAVQMVFTQFLPLYLHRERGFGLASASQMLTLYLACGAIGGFVGGYLADRFGGRNVILVSMAGSVPFLVLFFVAPGTASLAGLCLGGLILLFTIPVNVVMAQSLAPAQSGTVSALMMGFSWGMAGMIFVPFTGWLADQFSLHTALSAYAVLPLLGFLLALRLPR